MASLSHDKLKKRYDWKATFKRLKSEDRANTHYTAWGFTYFKNTVFT